MIRVTHKTNRDETFSDVFADSEADLAYKWLEDVEFCYGDGDRTVEYLGHVTAYDFCAAGRVILAVRQAHADVLEQYRRITSVQRAIVDSVMGVDVHRLLMEREEVRS